MSSASETAFFSLKPNDINELANSRRRSDNVVLEIRRKPKTLLATILILNNLFNVTITILSTYIMSLLFDMKANPMATFILNVVIVTSLVLILGEMMPKIFAAKKAMAIAVFLARPLNVMMKVFRPLSGILVNSTAFIDKRLARKTSTLSLSDLSTAVEITTDDTPPEEREMLKGIATFGEKEVSSVMQARVNVFAIPDTFEFEQLIRIIVENGFSRIPVYHDDLDEIVGILYVKDLLPHIDKKEFAWQKLVRQAVFVPENKKINDLFQDFRAGKTHIAIVVDEYGGTSGIITMEDILEEIVGDISDEFDEVKENEYYTKINDQVYLFEAQISIVDFCKVYDISEDYFDDVKGESDTIAGLILEIEGQIPKVGNKCGYKDFLFETAKADKRRIIQVKVVRRQ